MRPSWWPGCLSSRIGWNPCSMTRTARAIAQTLDNIRDTTAVFDRRSKDIDQLIVDSGETMHNLADASATLKTTLANLDRTSGNADRLIATANTTFEHATKLASDLDAVVQASRPGLRDLTTNGDGAAGRAAERRAPAVGKPQSCLDRARTRPKPATARRSS